MKIFISEFNMNIEEDIQARLVATMVYHFIMGIADRAIRCQLKQCITIYNWDAKTKEFSYLHLYSYNKITIMS